MGKGDTAGFVRYRTIYGSCRYIPGTVTVFAGKGTVWKNPTHGIPVFNPTLHLHCYWHVRVGQGTTTWGCVSMLTTSLPNTSWLSYHSYDPCRGWMRFANVIISLMFTQASHIGIQSHLWIKRCLRMTSAFPSCDRFSIFTWASCPTERLNAFRYCTQVMRAHSLPLLL